MQKPNTKHTKTNGHIERRNNKVISHKKLYLQKTFRYKFTNTYATPITNYQLQFN